MVTNEQLELITSDPLVLHGQARVAGTRVSVSVVLDCLAAGMTLLMSVHYLEAADIRPGEYYALILLGTVGMVLMSAAMELVLIFVALEISSIASYVLAGFRRRSRRDWPSIRPASR